MERSMTVTELVQGTGMKQGNVSKQLGVLLDARFVRKEKEGNFARYSIADPTLITLCQLMCARMEESAKRHFEAVRRRGV